MSPAYIKTGIQNEIRFMDFLEKANGVKWWFKNETNDKKYFAIKYCDSPILANLAGFMWILSSACTMEG